MKEYKVYSEVPRQTRNSAIEVVKVVELGRDRSEAAKTFHH
jgi:hypothetical protein